MTNVRKKVLTKLIQRYSGRHKYDGKCYQFVIITVIISLTARSVFVDNGVRPSRIGIANFLTRSTVRPGDASFQSWFSASFDVALRLLTIR